MTVNKTVKLAIVLSLCAPFMVGVAPQVAQSQTLFELLFKKRPRKPIAPLVEVKKVASPRFFNYSAPALKIVNFAALVKFAEEARATDLTSTGAITRNDANNNPTDENLIKSISAAVIMPELENQSFLDASITLNDYEVGARSDIGKAVVGHYVANPDFFWLENGKLSFKSQLVLDILRKADEVGLSAIDYDVRLPGEYATSRELVRFEMNMSLMAVRYALDARNGRVNPNKLSGYHDFPKSAYTATLAMAEITVSVSPSAYLAQANPDSKNFRMFRAALEKLKGETADIITIAEGTLIKPGKSHDELPNVIAAIRKKGDTKLLQRHGEALTAYSGTTEFTDGLVALVKGFQEQAKLKPDGIVGRNTISKLVDVDPKVKMNRVRLAMERLRWHPRKLGRRHVFINQPAYRARYFQDGEENLSMRAIVGKKSNQTSFFYDTIERVEYNPYWGVPQSIIINEMLPELRANPNYLDANGYEVTTLQGHKISSASVDWYSVGGGSVVTYNVRQYPGSRNALGELKILFPNKHAIYMHDTPSRSLFKKTTRALSHGCVRLQNPRGMAAAVLGTTVSKVAERISIGKNNAQKLTVQIPVYVAYFTAWPNKEGVVEYFSDIYDRDLYLIKAIDKVSAARGAAV